MRRSKRMYSELTVKNAPSSRLKLMNAATAAATTTLCGESFLLVRYTLPEVLSSDGSPSNSISKKILELICSKASCMLTPFATNTRKSISPPRSRFSNSLQALSNRRGLRCRVCFLSLKAFACLQFLDAQILDGYSMCP